MVTAAPATSGARSSRRRSVPPTRQRLPLRLRRKRTPEASATTRACWRLTVASLITTSHDSSRPMLSPSCSSMRRGAASTSPRSRSSTAAGAARRAVHRVRKLGRVAAARKTTVWPSCSWRRSFFATVCSPDTRVPLPPTFSISTEPAPTWRAWTRETNDRTPAGFGAWRRTRARRSAPPRRVAADGHAVVQLDDRRPVGARRERPGARCSCSAPARRLQSYTKSVVFALWPKMTRQPDASTRLRSVARRSSCQLTGARVRRDALERAVRVDPRVDPRDERVLLHADAARVAAAGAARSARTPAGVQRAAAIVRPSRRRMVDGSDLRGGPEP